MKSITTLGITGVIAVAVVVGGGLFARSTYKDGYQAGLEAAAEASPECPPYPGAEQHPVEHWVCETEEDWSKLLMDCNEEANAAHALMEITGDQEQELDWYRARCLPTEDGDEMARIRRNVEGAVRSMAGERAIRRKNEEDEQK